MDIAGVANSAADQISSMQGVAQANSAASAEQASILRDWQVQQNAKAMAFNRDEAAKNRSWQALMSNTAHQREVADLRAAGLNPVLSAMNGNGASVGSGATASAVTSAGAKGDVDTSASGAMANLLGSILMAEKSIEAANINARTEEAVADKYTAMNQIVAEIGRDATLGSAGIHAGASMYGADAAKAATMFAASEAASASRYASENAMFASMYGSDKHYDASKYSADRANDASKYNTDANVYMTGKYGKGQIGTAAGTFMEGIASLFGEAGWQKWLKNSDRKGG